MSKLNVLDPYEELFKDSNELKIININSLIEIKSKIESSLNKLTNHLFTDLKSDLNESLLTDDGYPKNDKDIVDIRFTRVAILKYKNDLTKVVDVISTRLDELFQNDNKTDKDLNNSNTIPFLKIDHVLKNSPAFEAGLETNDMVIEFNEFNVLNYKLSDIYSSIKINQLINLKIKRDNDTIKSLKLIPKNWSGEGLLGFKMSQL